VRRNPAWTAGFRGFRRFEFFRALAVGPRSKGMIGGPEAFTRVAPVAPAIRTPAHLPAPAFWRVEKDIPIF